MRVPSRLSVLAVAALIPTVLAACGSSKRTLAQEQPGEVVTAATQAIDHVHTVRVSGSIAAGTSATPIHLDLQLVNGRGARGTISEPGLSLELITVGDSAYVKGNAGFWQQYGAGAAAARLAGRWGRVPVGSAQFAAFDSLTDVHDLLATLLAGHGALTRGTTMTLGGQKVVSVHDATRQGTLYVAAKGPAYPVRIANSSSQGGRLDFGDFNAPVRLAAPGAAVTIPQSAQ